MTTPLPTPSSRSAPSASLASTQDATEDEEESSRSNFFLVTMTIIAIVAAGLLFVFVHTVQEIDKARAEQARILRLAHTTPNLNRNINVGRQVDKLPALTLPPAYADTSLQEQILTEINQERTIRGLPPAQLTIHGTAATVAAVAGQRDPTLPPVTMGGLTEAAGIWAMVPNEWSPVSLGAMWVWMYDDGWQGTLAGTSNLDCKSPTDPACNAHRKIILTPNPPGTTLYLNIEYAPTTTQGVDATSIAVEFLWAATPQSLSAAD